MKLKRLFALLLSLALLFSFAACGGKEPPAEDDGKDESKDESTDEAVTSTVYLAIKDYGLVTVELYDSLAPITVANFKKLVDEGFYDGLTFHRIIESFMIQGGDPLGNGTGGSGQTIRGEFSQNGVDTGIKHVAGTISMARSGHPLEGYHNAGYTNLPYEERAPFYNSASSQFFIVTETSTNNTRSLDGNYAAFGKVTEGMDIILAIASVETDEDDKPLSPVEILVATFDKAAAQAALANGSQNNE